METPDLHHLYCITAVNKSEVDMALRETHGGSWYSGSAVDACQWMSGTGTTPDGPWSLQVGRASPEVTIVGPVLARLDSSQLTGDPPYLIEVIINADLTATIAQRFLGLPPPPSDNC